MVYGLMCNIHQLLNLSSLTLQVVRNYPCHVYACIHRRLQLDYDDMLVSPVAIDSIDSEEGEYDYDDDDDDDI